MAERRVGVIMNGVTGRMGTNQHLVRSILSIREDGGVPLANGDVIMPEPLLVGRNENRVRSLAAAHGVKRWTTDLDAALSDRSFEVYFDAQVTQARAEAVRRAIRAGKAIYCEKPTADTFADSLAIALEARKAGVKNGVVQDKLWLPGMLKLRYLLDTGFFGRILSVRAEFGYWVFDGHRQPAQRPSWNYKKEEGGGIIIDMLCHWRYVIDNLFGPIKALSAFAAVHVPSRVDEAGREYRSEAEDAVYATFELASGTVCHFNSSWCVRVRRDDLLTVQVDGMNGTAVAGLRECWLQHDSATPKPVWNPDIESPIRYFDGWTLMPTRDACDNAFKAQWKLYLRHVAAGESFRWDLMEGARGVQLAELGHQSWRERRWVDVPEIG